MKQKIKISILFFFAAFLLTSFKGIPSNEKNNKEEQHQEIVDILSEEDSFILEDEYGVLENKIIVLDVYGNVILEKSISEEEEFLNKEELLTLSSADFLMENLGNKIYIQY